MNIDGMTGKCLALCKKRSYFPIFAWAYCIKKFEHLVLSGRRADHKLSPPSYEDAQRSPEYQVTEDERCVKVFPHLLSVQLLLLNTFLFLFGRNKETLAGQVSNSNVAQLEDPVSTTKSFFDDDDEFNPRAPTGTRGL